MMDYFMNGLLLVRGIVFQEEEHCKQCQAVIFTHMTKEFTLVWSMIKEVPVAMPASL